MKKRRKKQVLAILAMFAIMGSSASSLVYAHSNKFDMVTICHKKADGSFERIVTEPHATGDHFNQNGTPKEGHSNDLLFEGDEAQCPTSGGGGGGGSTTPPGTTTPPGGGTTPPGGGTTTNVCVPPQPITDIVVDTQALNDHKLMITWQGGQGAESIKISYGWDENNLDQFITTQNDGSEEITGLTNGVHYWFTLQAQKSGCPGEVSIKIDPLP